MTDDALDPRRAAELRTYAEGGVRPFDAVAIATAAQPRPRRWSRSLTLVLVGAAVLLAMLGIALAGGAVAPRLTLRTSLDPIPSGAPAEIAPGESATPAPEEATPLPSLPSQTPGTEEAGGSRPCAPMLQLLQTYVLSDVQAGLANGAPKRTTGSGGVLVGAAGGGFARLERRGSSLVRLDTGQDVEWIYPSLVPPTPESRISAAPDARAIAIEAGDLGQAGCGDPIVVLADGGRFRPFPSSAFELISTLAWAPDGSALYAVRRPTVDASGVSYFRPETGTVLPGPGTVVRWDSRTGEVTDLGGECGTCESLTVSPDGTKVAAWGNGRLWVHDESGWRAFFDLPFESPAGSIIRGWADEDSVVLADLRRIGLDGTTIAAWPAPCCHGTGYDGVLSPDGTTLAGVTMGPEFTTWNVTLLDMRDGFTRHIWTTADVRGCSSFGSGSSGRAECEAAGQPTPGPMAISGYARVVAWAPDASAVLVLDSGPDTSAARLFIVPLDGSGPGDPVNVDVPDLSATLGFPNNGPAVAWLPTP